MSEHLEYFLKGNLLYFIDGPIYTLLNKTLVYFLNAYLSSKIKRRTPIQINK